MPFTLASGTLTRANFAVAVKSFLDSLETAVDAKASTSELYPLGSAENPVTDPAAVRPSGIPAVWWRTATAPTNAITGDWVYLPDGVATTPTVTYVYQEEFVSTIGTYAARTNAGTLVWDASNATRSTGGSLKWTATATGASTVRAGAGLAAVSPSTNYVVSMMFRNNGAAARSAGVHLSYYTNMADFVDATPNQVIGGTQAVVTGTTFTEMTFAFTTPANCGAVEICPRINDAVLDETYHVDSIRLTAA